jgi:peptidoglycan hydrolase CwlO-like protein
LESEREKRVRVTGLLDGERQHFKQLQARNQRMVSSKQSLETQKQNLAQQKQNLEQQKQTLERQKQTLERQKQRLERQLQEIEASRTWKLIQRIGRARGRMGRTGS